MKTPSRRSFLLAIAAVPLAGAAALASTTKSRYPMVVIPNTEIFWRNRPWVWARGSLATVRHLNLDETATVTSYVRRYYAWQTPFDSAHDFMAQVPVIYCDRDVEANTPDQLSRLVMLMEDNAVNTLQFEIEQRLRRAIELRPSPNMANDLPISPVLTLPQIKHLRSVADACHASTT